MTQKDKDLLLKDLCARLPYGVKVCYIFNGEECVSTIEKIDAFSYIWDDYNGCYHVKEIKPYLFPMSSMTEEQKEFIKNRFCYDWDIEDHPYSLWTYCVEIGDVDELIDWLNKNHFDYRGLIPMGLAIDATGKNIY